MPIPAWTDRWTSINISPILQRLSKHSGRAQAGSHWLPAPQHISFKLETLVYRGLYRTARPLCHVALLSCHIRLRLSSSAAQDVLSSDYAYINHRRSSARCHCRAILGHVAIWHHRYRSTSGLCAPAKDISLCAVASDVTYFRRFRVSSV